MTLLLGLDTGGTFTDAVLMDDEGGTARVVAKAKALTTRHDLSIGLAGAAGAVMEASGADPAAIGLVSLSTTLATNALVEGQGGRVGLVSIGFSERDLARAGVVEALGGGPHVALAGGHDTHGREAAPLDLSALDGAAFADVGAVAVAGMFAVRDPSHELLVREAVRAATGLPVTCSHELSAKLNGPRRALTSVLNARLLPMIARLLAAADTMLADLGLAAAPMIVRGDGSLMARHFAADRPIETILSGPAASLVGAAHLAGTADAIVCDIGGTTSDIGFIDGGRPRLGAAGARVGGFATMVEAVAMDTYALGGDSEVFVVEDGLLWRLGLGPRRLVPVSLAAMDGEVHAVLDRQLAAARPEALDARFAARSGVDVPGLAADETALLGRIESWTPLDRLFTGRAERPVLDRLVAKGAAMIAGFTPSDAMHVVGEHDAWDAPAAHKAATLFARKRDRTGLAIAKDAETIARATVAAVKRRAAERLLESAWLNDGLDGAATVALPLVQRALDGADGVARTRITLDRPVIGLGASAGRYLPDAGRMLGEPAVVPSDADVANAIGAVVGRVETVVEIGVADGGKGVLTLTGLPDERRFTAERDAMDAAREAAERLVGAKAEAAGASSVVVTSETFVDAPTADGLRVFLGARVVARATGRPRSAV